LLNFFLFSFIFIAVVANRQARTWNVMKKIVSESGYKGLLAGKCVGRQGSWRNQSLHFFFTVFVSLP